MRGGGARSWVLVLILGLEDVGRVELLGWRGEGEEVGVVGVVVGQEGRKEGGRKLARV